MSLLEPVIHSHITDELPKDHPLAAKAVVCDNCDELLHAENNECMQTWVESGQGNFCLLCFAYIGGVSLEDEWSLPLKADREFPY